MKDSIQKKTNIPFNQPTAKRDGFIDFFKGLLILWILHIHTVFWSGMGYIPEAPRQLSLLIDVATFFFISGYLTKPLNFVSSFRKSAKQFINLYLNYLVFSCLLLFPLYIIFIFKDKAIPDLPKAIISMIKLTLEGELWGDIYVYPGSIWYMAVYFSLLLFIPLLVHFFDSRNRRIFILISLLIIFCFSSYYNWNYNILFTQTIYLYFYLFIYLLGLAYKIERPNIHVRYLKLTFLFNIILCLIIFFYLDQTVLNLQAQKFPPTFKYLIYSFLSIHLFAISKQIWRYPDSASTSQGFQFLEWCGKNSYYIYLIQGVVCSIPAFFIPVLINWRVDTFIVYVIVLIFNVLFTLLCTYFYLKIKTIFLDFMKTIKIRISIQ